MKNRHAANSYLLSYSRKMWGLKNYRTGRNSSKLTGSV